MHGLLSIISIMFATILATHSEYPEVDTHYLYTCACVNTTLTLWAGLVLRVASGHLLEMNTSWSRVTGLKSVPINQLRKLLDKLIM